MGKLGSGLRGIRRKLIVFGVLWIVAALFLVVPISFGVIEGSKGRQL